MYRLALTNLADSQIRDHVTRTQQQIGLTARDAQISSKYSLTFQRGLIDWKRAVIWWRGYFSEALSNSISNSFSNSFSNELTKAFGKDGADQQGPSIDPRKRSIGCYRKHGKETRLTRIFTSTTVRRDHAWAVTPILAQGKSRHWRATDRRPTSNNAQWDHWWCKGSHRKLKLGRSSRTPSTNL